MPASSQSVGSYVEVGHRRADQARCYALAGDHQRHARGTLEEAHLEPQAALAEHVAMVGAEQDDRVVEHAGAIEDRDELAELVVDIGDVGEIAAPRAADHVAA